MSSINIASAKSRISPHFKETPCFSIAALNDELGCNILLKAEFLTPIKAFKIRGAFNFVLKNHKEIGSGGIITHSSGNHGQALAYVGLKLNIPVTVVVPKNAPKIKVDAMKKWKASIAFSGNTIIEREQLCEELANKKNALIIPPYNHLDIIEGQGKSTLELIDKQDLDAIFCPIPGGGLTAGAAVAIKECGARASLYACEPEMAADAYNGFKAGIRQIQQSVDYTIADGLRTTVGELNFPIIKDGVSRVLLCNEEEIMAWGRKMLVDYNLLIEPSSAVVFACLAKHKDEFQGKKLGLIISGGNVDPKFYF